MVLRTKPGYDAVKFISEELNKFLMYSLEGAAVVFGDPSLFLHPFIGIVSFEIYCSVSQQFTNVHYNV